MGANEVRERLQYLADLAEIRRAGGELPEGMTPNTYLRTKRWAKAEARAYETRAVESGDDGDLEPVDGGAAFEPQSAADFNPSHVAMHEAAHAVVSIALGTKVESIWLTEDGGGRCRFERFDDMVARGERTQHAAYCRAVAVLAGGLVCPSSPRSRADEAIARNMTAEAGASVEFWQRVERRAVRMVEQYRCDIFRVATALDRRRKLTGDQVANIMEGKPLLLQRKPT